MKKFYKLIVAIAIFAGATTNLWAQNLAVDGATLRRDGYDAASAADAAEVPDMVTTGAVMPYYVIPDAIANPGYSLVAGVPTGALASSFTWGTNTATGTAAGAIAAVAAPTDYSAFTNYKRVTWSGIGTINLTTQEISGASCNGNTVTVPVQIIAAPTMEYTAASEATRCVSGTDGALTETFTAATAVLWTSSVTATRNLVADYTITCSNAGFNGGVALALTNQTITETGAGTGTITIPTTLTHFGTYTVTINAINDRISTKSSVDGTTANIAGGGTISAFTMVLNRVPVTGNVYHLPNF